MSVAVSDPTAIGRLTDVPPVDPHALVHFVTACQVAGVAVTGLASQDFRALIEQLSWLSIPDAVRRLHLYLHKEAARCR